MKNALRFDGWWTRHLSQLLFGYPRIGGRPGLATALHSAQFGWATLEPSNVICCIGFESSDLAFQWVVWRDSQEYKEGTPSVLGGGIPWDSWDNTWQGNN